MKVRAMLLRCFLLSLVFTAAWGCDSEERRQIREARGKISDQVRQHGGKTSGAGNSGETNVDLSGTNFGDDDMLILNGYRDKLFSLKLRGTPITDKGISQLMDVPYLRALDLGDTKVTDEGLAALRNLPSVNSLWLDGTAVTDRGLKGLEALPRLRTLDLQRTKVTEAGVQALRKEKPDLEIKVTK